MKSALLVSIAVALAATSLACGDAASSSTDLGSSGSSSNLGSSSGEGASSGGTTSSSASSSGGSSSSSSGEPFACPAGTQEKVLRIVAGNLSSGNHQDYNDGTGLRIFKGLEPDIGIVQEMNYLDDTDDDMRAFVDAGFGPEFYATPRYSGDIPNGVVSRYPILDSKERADPIGKTRSFVWARIDVPGDRDLVVFSVHLHTEAANRSRQAQNLMALVSETTGPNDLVVLGGDFNTATRDAEGVAEVSTHFVTAGPYPVDESGNDATNTNRILEGKGKPYDWVVAHASLQQRARTFTLGTLSFPNGFVFDSRVFSDLGLMPGVQPEDSQLHQHMAVARSFAVCE